MTDILTAATIASPLGDLTIVASDVGVRAVLWPDDDVGRVPAMGQISSHSAASPVTEAVHRQLDAYFDGTLTDFDLPLDPVGTEFQRQAWLALRSIPFGSTISYGEQADRMGDRNKARAVGAANGRNPISIIVPCHRVIGSSGALTGFAGGIEAKRFLLEHEQRVAGLTLV